MSKFLTTGKAVKAVDSLKKLLAISKSWFSWPYHCFTCKTVLFLISYALYYFLCFLWTSSKAYFWISLLFYQTPSNNPTPDQKFVPFINMDQPFTDQLPKSHDQALANPEEIKIRSRQFDSFLIFWAVNQIESAEMSKISAIVQYFSRGSAFVKDFVFHNLTGINMCFCFLKLDKNCMKKMVLRLLSFNLLMASTVFIFEIVSTCFTAPCLGRRIMLGW